MKKYTLEELKFIKSLPRKALEYIFKYKKPYEIDNQDIIPQNLKKIKASFVTLNKNGNLRGCIGKIIGVQPLYIDIIENSYLSAFDDPRFSPLKQEELNDIQIEISILENPKTLKYNSPSDLLKKLSKDKAGVIVSKDIFQATFLPQVWEEIPNPEKFLNSLCEKACLPCDEWKKGSLTIKTYTVTAIKENEN